MTRYLRQSSLVPPDRLSPALIIGLGGLGSHTAERLARTGLPRLILYDPDQVEEHNLGSQAFLNSAVGQLKVQAMQEKLALVSQAEVEVHPEAFADQPILKGAVVICLPDSMTVRQNVWQQRIKYNPSVPLYIEARMAGLFGRIYAVDPCDPDHVEWYDRMMYADWQAEQLPCTARGVDFNCCGMAVFMAAIIAAWATDRTYPNEIILDFVSWQLVTQSVSDR